MAFLNVNISTAETPYIISVNTDQIAYAQDNGDGTCSFWLHGAEYIPQGKTFDELKAVLSATDFLAA